MLSAPFSGDLNSKLLGVVGILGAVVLGVTVGVAGPGPAIALLLAPAAVFVGAKLIALAATTPTVVILPTVACSLVLAQAPVLVSGSLPARVLVTGGFAAVAVIALMQRRTMAYRTRSSGVVLIFLFLLLVALLRGARSGAYGDMKSAVLLGAQLAAVLAIAWGYARSAKNADDLANLATALVLAPAIYVGVNLFLVFAASYLPIPMPEQQSVALGAESTTLAALGISIDRVQLPMALSINNVGVVAAAGFAAGVVLAFRGGRKRVGLIAASVCLVGVLIADTRTSLFIGIVVAVLSLVRPRGRWATPIAVILPLSPFIVVWVVQQLNDSVGTFLSAGGRDFSTGSNRFLIWERAIDTAAHPASLDSFDRLQTILFGYGAGGHIASGAAYRYEYLFRGQEYTLAHTHNVAIQTMLDTGLVGIIALASVALVGVLGLGRLVQMAGGAAAAALALFVVLLGGGVTEAVPTYISPEALMLTLIALGLVMVRPRDGSAWRTAS